MYSCSKSFRELKNAIKNQFFLYLGVWGAKLSFLSKKTRGERYSVDLPTWVCGGDVIIMKMVPLLNMLVVVPCSFEVMAMGFACRHSTQHAGLNRLISVSLPLFWNPGDSSKLVIIWNDFIINIHVVGNSTPRRRNCSGGPVKRKSGYLIISQGK